MLPTAPVADRLCDGNVGALWVAENGPEYAPAPLRLTAARSELRFFQLAPDEALNFIRAAGQGLGEIVVERLYDGMVGARVGEARHELVCRLDRARVLESNHPGSGRRHRGGSLAL